MIRGEVIFLESLDRERWVIGGQFARHGSSSLFATDQELEEARGIRLVN